MARQTLQGIVTKAGFMAKTVTMTVEKRLIHPKLLKEYVRHKKYLIHDEFNKLQVGDKITVEHCRPLSPRKRFTLIELHGSEQEIERRRTFAQSQLSAEDIERTQIAKRIRDEVALVRGSTVNNPNQSKKAKGEKTNAAKAASLPSSVTHSAAPSSGTTQS